VSFHPTTTIFKLAATCVSGYVTVTTWVGVCGVAAAACAKLIGTTVVNVNALLRLPLCVSGFVTVTVTAPAACAGVVAVICVPLTTTTLVAAVPPNVTVAPETKFVPVIVTLVPPPTGPLFGTTLLTLGAGEELAVLNVTICITQGPDELKGAV